MFKQFNLSSIQVETAKRLITLKFNFDIEAESVKGDSINVVSYDSHDHVAFKTEVKNDLIFLHLQEYPEPNIKYQVIIEKEIKNIAGMNLNSSYRRIIVFESPITDKPVIKSPYNFEKQDKVDIVFDAAPKDSYRVQIAKENRFYNLVYNSKIYESEIKPEIPDLEDGQYYIRARIEKNDELGPWCDPVTFIYKYSCDCEIPIEDGPSANATMPIHDQKWLEETGENVTSPEEETTPELSKPEVPSEPDDGVEVEDALEIITYPESGQTTNSFVFEFDRDLDPDSVEVVIIRRDF